MKAAAKATKTKVAKRPQKVELIDGRNDPAVASFFRSLEHPLKKELALIRKDILAVSPAIQEGIKWNAPSFRTSDWFATFNVHGKGSIRIILHNGAKAKATAQSGLEIKDPPGLLKWLAKDRCLVTFENAKDVAAKRAALKAIVKSWISQL